MSSWLVTRGTTKVHYRLLYTCTGSWAQSAPIFGAVWRARDVTEKCVSRATFGIRDHPAAECGFCCRPTHVREQRCISTRCCSVWDPRQSSNLGTTRKEERSFLPASRARAPPLGSGRRPEALRLDSDSSAASGSRVRRARIHWSNVSLSGPQAIS